MSRIAAASTSNKPNGKQKTRMSFVAAKMTPSLSIISHTNSNIRVEIFSVFCFVFVKLLFCSNQSVCCGRRTIDSYFQQAHSTKRYDP